MLTRLTTWLAIVEENLKNPRAVSTWTGGLPTRALTPILQAGTVPRAKKRRGGGWGGRKVHGQIVVTRRLVAWWRGEGGRGPRHTNDKCSPPHTPPSPTPPRLPSFSLPMSLKASINVATWKWPYFHLPSVTSSFLFLRSRQTAVSNMGLGNLSCLTISAEGTK